MPAGDLARTVDEAAAVAKHIGYPVVLKAQAAALSHKTEAGGVMLNLADEATLRAAWDTMMKSVKRAAPDVTLDGALVEKMSQKGIELMVGAKRDPAGAPATVGLGGIWVEKATCIAAGGSVEDQVAKRCASCVGQVLAGVRGAPPADTDAVVKVVMAIGRVMQTMPEVIEVDVNPLMVHAKGQGVTALDALIVTE